MIPESKVHDGTAEGKPGPDYEWVCQNCQHSNGSGASKCAACGFTARFTVRQLREVQGLPPEGLALADICAGAGLLIVGAVFYLVAPGWMLLLGLKLVVSIIFFGGALIFWLLKFIVKRCLAWFGE